ncbi:unnamed protein product [Adineta steineri]|uniref:Peptidase C14 caspase domain-containing protein n=1 Tax=Adineta steineri TaxID=433720 RepID=A0A818N610_9BILA|nr:unnamed protein product [Adineta steineri]CAF3600116.1 unnamed protein product [Adineta steineri]
MDEIILAFVDQIKENDIVIFYFAGHGVEIKNQYFLIPTNDQRITNNRLYNKRAIDTEGTLELIMEQKPLAGIFLFDCSFSYLQDNNIISKTTNLNLRISPNSIAVYSRVLLSRPQHQNGALEQLIINQKGDSKLTLSRQEVNDENIDIVVPSLNSRR